MRTKFSFGYIMKAETLDDTSIDSLEKSLSVVIVFAELSFVFLP